MGVGVQGEPLWTLTSFWSVARLHLISNNSSFVHQSSQSRRLVANQEKIGEEMTAEFYLLSISFILFGMFKMP
jgi:hypothetical protein